MWLLNHAILCAVHPGHIYSTAADVPATHRNTVNKLSLEGDMLGLMEETSVSLWLMAVQGVA